MVNWSDLFVSLVFGLSIPLMVSGTMRTVLGENWPTGWRNKSGSEQAMAAGLALFAGPGILIDRLVADFRAGKIDANDCIYGGLAALGWALVYGFVALKLLS